MLFIAAVFVCFVTLGHSKDGLLGPELVEPLCDKKQSGEHGGPIACIDQNRCCRFWASVGECESNSKTMADSCPKSCKVCNKTGGDDDLKSIECADISSKCPQWASKKECTKNIAWMEENCPVSCKTCGRTLADLRLICGGRTETATGDKKVCKDYYNDCQKWAKNGDCKTNAWWMGENCALACNVCQGPSKVV